MSAIDYLPQSEGWLPYWLLFAATMGLGNCVQAYTTLHFTSQVYNGSASPSSSSSSSPSSNSNNNPQVTRLQSRTFGTWTVLASIIRIYAAYNITNPAMYQLGLWTYVIAWGHFMSEWLVFGTARWGRGLAGPAIVANLSLVWMVGSWGFYVR